MTREEKRLMASRLANHVAAKAEHEPCPPDGGIDHDSFMAGALFCKQMQSAMIAELTTFMEAACKCANPELAATPFALDPSQYAQGVSGKLVNDELVASAVISS
jgi:hypothetical protein